MIVRVCVLRVRKEEIARWHRRKGTQKLSKKTFFSCFVECSDSSRGRTETRSKRDRSTELATSSDESLHAKRTNDERTGETISIRRPFPSYPRIGLSTTHNASNKKTPKKPTMNIQQ
mmetsp:Transcript_682/g.1492  ORF Transcript_682/g.1492 Transcript_682/m.1492 type:complete len:117 (+) Transcript_682:122-472(+)